MMEEASQALLLLEALGIGLLIGIERERNGGENGGPAPIGVRTFSLASLIGALSQYAGGLPLLAVALAAVGVLRAVAHLSQTDRQTGMTTSLALLLVVVLGGGVGRAYFPCRRVGGAGRHLAGGTVGPARLQPLGP